MGWAGTTGAVAGGFCCVPPGVEGISKLLIVEDDNRAPCWSRRPRGFSGYLVLRKPFGGGKAVPEPGGAAGATPYVGKAVTTGAVPTMPQPPS